MANKPNLQFFLLLRPQKAFPCAETRFEPFWSLSVLRCDLEAARRVQKKKEQKLHTKNRSLRRTPPRRPTSTKFCMLGRIPDIFLGIEFQKDQLENVGAVGVEI